jgi:tRNA uridine 5-carboxymethylaminomethyl modification enzyme
VLSETLVRTDQGDRVPASQYLKRPEVRLEQMVSDRLISLALDDARPEIDLASVETSIKYAGYLRRQESEIERGRRDERRRIPSNFPFERVPGLSKEVVQRLSQVRPDTLGHALRIPGVTPAAVAVLSAYVGRFPAVNQ